MLLLTFTGWNQQKAKDVYSCVYSVAHFGRIDQRMRCVESHSWTGKWKIFGTFGNQHSWSCLIQHSGELYTNHVFTLTLLRASIRVFTNKGMRNTVNPVSELGELLLSLAPLTASNILPPNLFWLFIVEIKMSVLIFLASQISAIFLSSKATFSVSVLNA